MRRNWKKLLVAVAVLGLAVNSPMTRMNAYAVEESTDAQEMGFVIDTTGTLVGYSGIGGDVVIPSEVVAIASNVFAGNTSITSVTIPGSVAVLGTGVFSNCKNLTTVVIQGNISSIPDQTFYGCENLRSISVPGSVTSIGSEAFAECVSLSGITIPSAVTVVGDRAFYGCISLAGVSIPVAVSSIGSDAFTGCSNMTTYTVDGSNGTYASSGGCLYNKTLTRFIDCPEGRSSVSVSSSTKTIASEAFRNCYAIQSLALPTSVSTIEANAFAGSGISDITILSGVTSIGSQSDWTAAIIYGEANSVAENYANANEIVFQALNAAPPQQDNTETPDTEEPGSETPEKPETPNTENPDTEIPDTETPNTETPGGTDTPATPNTPGTGSQGGTNVSPYSSSSNVSSSDASHAKDATPKTGDGVNPILFFNLALLLLGGVFLFLGRKKA